MNTYIISWEITLVGCLSPVLFSTGGTSVCPYTLLFFSLFPLVLYGLPFVFCGLYVKIFGFSHNDFTFLYSKKLSILFISYFFISWLYVFSVGNSNWEESLKQWSVLWFPNSLFISFFVFPINFFTFWKYVLSSIFKINPHLLLSSLNTYIISCFRNGILFADKYPTAFDFSQTRSYLNHFGLLLIRATPYFVVVKKQYIQFFLHIFFNSIHILSKSIGISHLQSVWPYGRSTNIKSIDFLFIFGNMLKQSSL